MAGCELVVVLVEASMHNVMLGMDVGMGLPGGDVLGYDMPAEEDLRQAVESSRAGVTVATAVCGWLAVDVDGVGVGGRHRSSVQTERWERQRSDCMDEVAVGSSRTAADQRLHRRRVLLLWQHSVQLLSPSGDSLSGGLATVQRFGACQTAQP